MKFLISSGANIECQSMVNQCTPLHAASQLGYLNIVKYLISKGANIECQTDQKFTPLMISILYKHKSISELLIDLTKY